MNLDAIKNVIRQIDPSLEENEHDFQAAVTMYAAAIHIDNIKFLATFTKYGQKRCGDIIRNLRANKVVKNHKWDVQWSHTNDGVLAFILDTLVACGYCERINDNDGHSYQMTDEGISKVDRMPVLT